MAGPTEAPIKPVAHPLKKRLLGALIIILVLGLAWFSAQYWFAQRELSKLKEPGAAASYEAEQTITAVGRLIALPDEKPTIATVDDASKLKEQVFFKEAHNGDKVLMYASAKKAILYRPADNKVIEVASINISSKQ